MADVWHAFQFALYWIGWPGLVAASVFTVYRAASFYKGLRHTAPGLLVLLTVAGWVATLIGVAVLGTLYLERDPVTAGPVVLPIFIVWAGSLVVSVYVMQRWGHEAVKLDAYYGELEHIARMKSGFINHVAHELNTPMTPIRIQLDLLQRGDYGDLSERQEAAIDRLRRNLVRLGRLVDQVVLASIIQSGRLQLKFDQMPVTDLLQAAVDGARGMLPDPPEVETDIGQDRSIEVDVNQMGYAIQHLIYYAMRHHAGGRPVKVRLEEEDAEALVLISYQGDLEGERIVRLFTDPLFLPREDTSGMGLELFIAHGIISLHGGTLRIQQRGPDIRFFVHLLHKARRREVPTPEGPIFEV